MLAGTAFSAYYTLQVTGWTVMTDELQVLRLGVSVAQTLNPLPRIRGESIGAYSQLYPIASAPAYALFSMPTAFKVVHFLNSLFMASAAIPAYLLTRKVVVWRPAALVVAATTVLVPWMAMGTMVLTEGGAYPVFVWVVLAVYMALIRPSWKRDLVALAAIVIGFFARTQFVVLAAAFPLSVIAHELGYTAIVSQRASLGRRLVDSLRRIVREHLPLTVVTLAGVLGLLIPSAHDRLLNLLGNYSATATGSLLPAGSGAIVQQMTAVVGVAVGVLPFVLGVGWVLGAAFRPGDKSTHAFAVLTFVTGILLGLEVTSFLVRFSGAVQDRYIFYLVPLLFVATAACLLDPRIRWNGVAIATGVLAWVTTKTDFTLSAPRSYFGSPPTAFNEAITTRATQIGKFLGSPNLDPRPVILVVVIVVGIASIAAMRLMPRRALAAIVGIGLIVFLTAETRAVTARMTDRISAGDATGNDWVDRHVPGGQYASMIPGAVNQRNDGVPVFLDRYTQIVNWWTVEFWNKSAQRLVPIENESLQAEAVPAIAPFATAPATVDARTGVLTPPLPSRYVVVSASDDWLRLRGRSILVHNDNLELMHVPASARADWISRNLPADGWTEPHRPFQVRIFNQPTSRGRVRRLRLTLDSVPEIRAARRYTVSTSSGSTRGAVRANAFKTIAVDVCMRGAAYEDVQVRVDGSTPITWLEGRAVGLHVSKIEAGAAGARCKP